VDFQKILCTPANPLLLRRLDRRDGEDLRWARLGVWSRSAIATLKSVEKLRTRVLETVPGKVNKLVSRSLRGSTLSASKLRGGGNCREGVFLPP
jgi:hypothetical protein